MQTGVFLLEWGIQLHFYDTNLEILWLQSLLINHTVDAMHSEKNLAHNLVHTIMGTRDTDAVRADLKQQNVFKHLWIQETRNADGTTGDGIKPSAPYCLKPAEVTKFLKVLSTLKVPTDFSSNLAKCVTAKKKLSGLKSHDYHQLMQQVLPLAVMGLLDEGPRLVIGRVSSIWRRICAKVWDPDSYRQLKEDVAFTLCLLEMHFPPSFFVIMTHLMVHIVEEVELCGPVSCRWMYPIERDLKICKSYVRNMARPEASIAEGYLVDEALGFLYHMDVVVASGIRKGAKVKANEAEYEGVQLEGSGTVQVIPHADLMAMHHCVLENEEAVKPWMR